MRQSLREQLLALRDRLLASQRFQRWAAASPLTRTIARRRARELFDLCAGFVYSQVLYACVELRLFEALSAGPRTTFDLAEGMALPAAATERLLAAAASLRLLERSADNTYRLGVLGAALLANPGVLAMIEHHTLLYADLRDPVALLRGAKAGTRLARYWAYAGARAEGLAAGGGAAALATGEVAEYSALMARSQHLVANDILDAYQIDRHKLLLDVGGGTGAFLIAAAAHAPRLHLALFDLPAVTEIALAALERAGLAARVAFCGGDFRLDALPAGADLVTLIRVLHDHDDDVALGLLRSVWSSLPAGGVLLIAEPMAGTPGAEAMGDAYFGFYLLAMGSGRPRSARSISAMARAAGFARAEQVATRRPLLMQLVVCRR